MHNGAFAVDELVRACAGAWRAARAARRGVARRARGVRAHTARPPPAAAPRAQAHLFHDGDLHEVLIAYLLDDSVGASTSPHRPRPRPRPPIRPSPYPPREKQLVVQAQVAHAALPQQHEGEGRPPPRAAQLQAIVNMADCRAREAVRE